MMAYKYIPVINKLRTKDIYYLIEDYLLNDTINKNDFNNTSQAFSNRIEPI